MPTFQCAVFEGARKDYAAYILRRTQYKKKMTALWSSLRDSTSKLVGLRHSLGLKSHLRGSRLPLYCSQNPPTLHTVSDCRIRPVANLLDSYLADIVGAQELNHGQYISMRTQTSSHDNRQVAVLGLPVKQKH